MDDFNTCSNIWIDVRYIYIFIKKNVLEVNKKGILIKTILYPTNLDWEEVEINEIEVINMNEENIKIGIRTNGVGLPGMQIGWFNGNMGKMKLYITDKSEVLRIPTKNGYIIYFSTKEGEEIINEIKQVNIK